MKSKLKIEIMIINVKCWVQKYYLGGVFHTKVILTTYVIYGVTTGFKLS